LYFLGNFKASDNYGCYNCGTMKWCLPFLVNTVFYNSIK